jgi:hypothetical protein
LIVHLGDHRMRLGGYLLHRLLAFHAELDQPPSAVLRIVAGPAGEHGAMPGRML